MRAERTIAAFVIANSILAAIWIAFVAVLAIALVSMTRQLYGVSPSPDPVEDLIVLIAGLLGMLALYIPGAVALVGAAIGLSKRAAWAYHWHLAGAWLVGVSFFGLIYTAIAL